MSAESATGPVLCRLFELPLGSRFRYAHPAVKKSYVLLNRFDCGLVADAPNNEQGRVFQGLYSAADSPDEFRQLMVEFVPVQEVTSSALPDEATANRRAP